MSSGFVVVQATFADWDRLYFGFQVGMNGGHCEVLFVGACYKVGSDVVAGMVKHRNRVSFVVFTCAASHVVKDCYIFFGLESSHWLGVHRHIAVGCAALQLREELVKLPVEASGFRYRGHHSQGQDFLQQVRF